MLFRYRLIQMMAFLLGILAGGVGVQLPWLVSRSETENGPQAIETIQPGDLVWCRDDDDPSAPLQLKPVEQVFERWARVLEVNLPGGVSIGTTTEHPFWVVGKGWVWAGNLVPGDQLLGEDGQEVAVESITPTDLFEKVYNLRVADNHTYFVRSDGWGFSVWVHNARCGENSRNLRIQLIKAYEISGKIAAHLVPTGSFSNRNELARKAVKTVQDILNKAGIGYNHYANGFFTESARHLGTHTNKFFLYLEGELSAVGGKRKAIISKLIEIGNDLKALRIKF